MTVENAIKTGIAIKYNNGRDLEIIRNILLAKGVFSEGEWLPDERYSYVIVDSSKTYHLSTYDEAYGSIGARSFIASNINQQSVNEINPPLQC